MADEASSPGSRLLEPLHSSRPAWTSANRDHNQRRWFFRDHSKTRSGTAKSARENNIQASGRSIAFWCNVAGIGMKSQILNIGIQAQTSTPSLKSMPEDHRQRCQNSQN
jgi:hypothetical protein